MDSNAAEILNQLLVMHCRSLPRYVASAQPHRQRGDAKAAEILAHIVEDQELMVDRIAEYLKSEDQTVETGEFPMEFTDLHDLSMDFIMQQVLQKQKEEIADIEFLSAQLNDDPRAKALAQEALGAAKGHLQSLEECLASVAS